MIKVVRGRYNSPGMASTRAALFLTAMLFSAGAASAQPLIDNDRVTVWDTTTPHAYAHDIVAITLADGKAVFVRARDTERFRSRGVSGQAIIVELKDSKTPPLLNKSDYPNAFPRPGSVKLIENKRVIVWDYRWTSGAPTPMHFHDKHVVVVYLENGSLKSTTPSGETVVNDYSAGTVKYNTRDRTHTETLVKGSQHAIIVELK